MKKIFTLAMAGVLAGTGMHAQVKNNYQYSTSTPYGTLDIRTRISSSDYYYLQENKTFSFRESSPGVKTNKYLDMTSWESSPYRQGNLRHKVGTKDLFVMNYRLLFPVGYKSTYTQGYPMIVLMHGAVERGNCYYKNCYHVDGHRLHRSAYCGGKSRGTTRSGRGISSGGSSVGVSESRDPLRPYCAVHHLLGISGGGAHPRSPRPRAV